MRREVRDEQHGTLTGYSYGCRCEACKFEASSYWRRRNGGGQYKPELRDHHHGTPTGYNYGCRCEDCCAAKADYNSVRKAEMDSVLYASFASRDEVKQWASGLGFEVHPGLHGKRADALIARYNREHPDRPYLRPDERKGHVA